MEIKQLHKPSRTEKSYDEVKMDLFVPPGGKTKNYYVRVYVPSDLRGIYGKAEFRQSTQTADKLLAQARAAVFLSAKTKEFLEKRQALQEVGLDPAVRVVLDNDLIQQVCSVRLASLIGFDEAERDSMLDDGQWDEHEDLIRTNVEDLNRVIARRKAAPAYQQVTESAIEFADTMGYRIDSHDPQLGNFVLAFAKADKRAFEIMSLRSQGESPTLTQGEAGPWLSDLLEGWESEHATHLPEKTRGTYKTRIQHFIDFVKNKPVAGVERSDIWNWLVSLKDNDKLAKKTVKDGYVPALRTFFEFAVNSGRFGLNESPCTKIQLPKWSKQENEERKRPRYPFNTTYLNQIFASDWFAGQDVALRYRSEVVTAGNARYWVPLISLMHGLRPEEICQMTLLDVGQQAGVLSINVTDEAEFQQTKNESSKRWIPIHSLLLKLGFADYVDAQRKAQSVNEPEDFFRERGPGEIYQRPTVDGRLFPELRTEFARQSNAFLKRFNDYLHDELKFERGFTYYSLRHSWEDMVREARAKDALDGKAWPNGMYERISGRAMATVESQEGSGALYGRGIPPNLMQPYIERLQFTGLKPPKSWREFTRRQR